MAERPLPESIRGSWYYLPASVDPKAPPEKPHQVLRFRLDGTFTRYLLTRNGEWSEKESGDYTFDGQFLIIRGRNTDTYRVRPEAFWRWNLEGKKEDMKLLRGRIKEEDFVSLPPEDRKEIRILPIRVVAESPVEEGDESEAIYELVYKNEDRRQLVGALFLEHDPDSHKMWIGVTPIAEGIEPKTWERIIRESFLDLRLGKPSDVRVVTIRLVDTDESRVFNYELV